MEINTRTEFANALRYARITGTLRSYGRLGAFGRSLILRDGARFTYPAWTSRSSMSVVR